MEEKVREIAELLKILANENRLMILCALMDQSMTVSEISDRIPDISQSALSQHLSIFRAHGILNYIKSGQNIIYSIADHRIEEILNTIKKYYCSDLLS